MSMAIFAVVTGTTVAVANQYKDFIPEPEDVQMAFVGNQRWSVTQIGRFLNDKYPDKNIEFSDWKRNSNIITYEDKDNIENIAELHKEILKDQTFYYQSEYYMTNDFVIAYWMKDGSTIIRNYTLTQADKYTKEHEAKNESANKIINSKDYKKQDFYYLYDEKYYSGRNLYVRLKNINDYGTVLENISLNDLRNALTKDIDNFLIGNNSAFEFLMNYNMHYKRDATLDKQEYLLEIYEKVSDEDENYLDEIYLSDEFVNTLNYLK